jgi:hypothetical protein
MKVFEESWVGDLERKYHYASKYTTPFIARLALDPFLSNERTKIEEWFQALPEDVKQDILGRLRSESSHQHFSAHYELVLYEFFKDIGYSVTIHPKLKEGEPDLLVTGKNLDKPIIIEVATVFDDPEWEKEQQKLDRILEQLDKIEHYFFIMVSVESEPIPERVDYERLKQFVTQWLDSFDLKITHEFQETEYQADGLKLKLTVIPRKTLERKPIVGSYMLPARFIGTIQLRRVLQKKINKYKGVKELGLPFIIALSLADTPLDEEAIIRELFGKMQLTIKRNLNGEVVKEWGRDFSGLVTPKPGLDGKAQNTRLSAVLEVKSKWLPPKEENGEEGRKHFLRVIHNPFASTPLDHRIFKDYPQLVRIVEDNKPVSLQWIGQKSEEAFD